MEDKLRSRFQDANHKTGNDPIPAGHRKRFEQKLAGQKSEVPFYRRTWVSAVAAVAALILIGTFYVKLSTTENTQTAFKPMHLNEVSAELGDAERFLAESLSAKQNKADSLLKDNPELKGFLEQLHTLEEEYTALELALGQNNNEKIIAAMIHNYRLRLELLEQMFLKHQSTQRMKQQHS